MLVIIQFPIIDFRGIINENSYKLNKPYWPNPESYPRKQFVRKFGAAEARKSGGLTDISGENKYCKAHHAIKFCLLEQILKKKDYLILKPQCKFRRIFSNNLLSRVELGLIYKTTRNSCIDIIEFIKNFLNLPVRIDNNNCIMQDAGVFLSKLLSISSTHTKKSKKIKNWWITPGDPLVIIELSSDEYFHFFMPKYIENIDCKEDPSIKLSYFFVNNRGFDTSVWLINTGGNSNKQTIRNLRLYLSRIHADKICLRKILNNENTDFRNAKKLSDNVQSYLNETINIFSKTKYYGITQKHILQSASYYDELFTKDDLYKLKDIRQNIKNKIGSFIDRNNIEEKDDFKGNIIHIEGDVMGDFVMHDKIGGNQYNAPVGSVSEKININDDHSVQITNNDITSGKNTEILHDELNKLINYLKENAETSYQMDSMANVKKADEALKNKNNSNVLKFLKEAGKWALDNATKIGVSVAADVIKKACGL